MLNDPTKDQVPPSEVVEKGEGAKVAESAGNFNNHLQNQQGLIGLVGNRFYFRNSTSKELTNKEVAEHKWREAALEKILAEGDGKLYNALNKIFENAAVKKLSNAYNKFLDNKVVDKTLGVLFTPIGFASWTLNRIYFRSSGVQKICGKMTKEWDKHFDRMLANKVAKNWAKDTGADSFAEAGYAQEAFNRFQDLNDGIDGLSGLERSGAKKRAGKWAKKVGASPEAEKEYANEILSRKVIGTDFDRLTRNEFKKKYPHIRTPEYTADLTNRRVSVARLIKAIRGYRVPDIAEQNAFFKQIYSPQFKIGKPLSF